MPNTQPPPSPPFFYGIGTADRVLFAILICLAIMALPYIMFGTGWIRDLGDLKTADKAAVFQAVGSVVAIVAGAGAIYWQVRRQREAAREAEIAERVRKLHLLSGSIFWCRVACAHLTDVSAAGLPVRAENDRLKHQCEALRAVPALEMPDWRASYAVSQAVQTYLVYESRLEPERTELSKRLADDRLKWANLVSHNFDFAEQLLEESLKELGANLPGLTYASNRIMGGDSILVEQGVRS